MVEECDETLVFVPVIENGVLRLVYRIKRIGDKPDEFERKLKISRLSQKVHFHNLALRISREFNLT